MKDLHTHTLFSDGQNTPEEMVQAAIALGYSEIGISDHSYTFFDESYCIKKEDIYNYIAEIKRLKEIYKDKITVRLGIEQDYFSDYPTDEFEYSVGSVHYIKVGKEYFPVDETAEILQISAKKYFNGDIYALCEKYFELVGDILSKTNADIIGHFDLITKFNEKTHLFDEKNPRYIAAWKKAADKLLKFGKPFEINYGAVNRGYRASPYPSADIINYVKSNGGKFVISSDGHSTENIKQTFEKNKTKPVI